MCTDEPIEILAGYQSDGVTYKLRPLSLLRIQKHYPEANPVRSVFVGYETKDDLERMYGSVNKQVVLLLTGLGSEQISVLGGYRVVEPSAGRVVEEKEALD